MTLYKSIEITSTSEKSWSDAVKLGYEEAKKTIKHIRNIQIIKSDVKVKEEEDKLIFRVTMHINFEIVHEGAESEVKPAETKKTGKKAG